MAEGREHRLLVRALVGHLQARHVTVLSADSRGWPRSAAVGQRRPDVYGYYQAGGAAVAGEAKRGPELWACRSQLEELAAALPEHGPRGAGAVLVLAVGEGFRDEAEDFARTMNSGRTSVTVWSPGAARA